MARKTKAEIAKAAVSARKRASRERAKMNGITRLEMEPEVYTVHLFAQLAKVTGRSRGDLLSDLLESVPVSDLQNAPKWSTRDCTAQSMEVTIPMSVSETLGSRPGLSAGSVLEWLVLERCWVLTDDDVGMTDSTGLMITDTHVETNTLCYIHPGDKVFVITKMHHVAGGVVDAKGEPFDKYAHRLLMCSEASRQHQCAPKQKPWDEYAMVALVQESAIYRAQELQHRLATNFHEEDLLLMYRHRA